MAGRRSVLPPGNRTTAPLSLLRYGLPGQAQVRVRQAGPRVGAAGLDHDFPRTRDVLKEGILGREGGTCRFGGRTVIGD